MYALKKEDGGDLKDKAGKPSNVTISIEYQYEAPASQAVVTREVGARTFLFI